MARAALPLSLSLLLLLLLLLLAAACRAQEQYSDSLDATDLDAILGNDQLLDGYVQCFLQSGDDGCSAEGKAVKRVLSEALPSNCAKCTERQRRGMAKVVSFLYRNRRADWDRLQSKFDPSGRYLGANPALAN